MRDRQTGRRPRRAVMFAVFTAAALLAALNTGCCGLSGQNGCMSPMAAETAPVGLVLPPAVYCVPGVEMNIYFDNVTLVVNPANYVFDVTCRKGIQQTERWTFTPAPEDVGEYSLKLDVRDGSNVLLACAQTRICVAPADAGAGRAVSLLAIGDSLTKASVYTQHLLDLCAGPGNPALTLVGTNVRASGLNRHEGYGGWTAQRFATKFGEAARQGGKSDGSPFLYAGTDGRPELDFRRYCRDVNGGKGPDFVTILLGCNDTFSATDDTIVERMDTMFTHYDRLIGAVRAAAPETRLGLLLLVPPAATQDAFGANYSCGQTRWQYKRNQARVVDRMIEHYGGREAERICLLPANVNLDCVNNYPTRTRPANARSDAAGTRLNNGVHPAGPGYKQIGDTIYCWLKTQLASAAE